MQSYFNPTKRNMKKSLNRVKTNNSTSKQDRKLKFGVQSYFNTTKINMKKKIGVTSPPPPCNHNLNRVKTNNSFFFLLD